MTKGTTFNPRSFADIQSDMNGPAVTQKDITFWIAEHFDVSPGAIWFDTKSKQGMVNIYIEGITEDQQNQIFEQLSEIIPVGVRIYIHRGLPPRKPQPININRPPLWDVED